MSCLLLLRLLVVVCWIEIEMPKGVSDRSIQNITREAFEKADAGFVSSSLTFFWMLCYSSLWNDMMTVW
jgi:hypothetical protein